MYEMTGIIGPTVSTAILTYKYLRDQLIQTQSFTKILFRILYQFQSFVEFSVPGPRAFILLRLHDPISEWVLYNRVLSSVIGTKQAVSHSKFFISEFLFPSVVLYYIIRVHANSEWDETAK